MTIIQSSLVPYAAYTINTEEMRLMGSHEKLSATISGWQNDLIDFSRFNRSLYYTDTGRGAGIQLRRDATSLFHALERGQPVAISSKDTTLEPLEFERKFNRTRRLAREAQEDRGVTILYVAFGLLEWRETPSSEWITSPLILCPALLKPDRMTTDFLLSRAPGGEFVVNPTLEVKLQRDFRIHLPKYEAILHESEVIAPAATAFDEDEVPARQRKRRLGDLLAALRDALPSDTSWRIRPEAHLGTFSFQKLAMYQDMQTHTDQLLHHPLVQAFGGDRSHLVGVAETPRAGELDARVRPHDVFEVVDADSSQEEAIAAAKAGASFVLQGPPGTGKSQTITNIIAECLALERRVLFVSEKMAALEVVRDRLAAVGLADYCLDLHGQRADKKQFIASLSRALDADEGQGRRDVTSAAWERESNDLLAAREKLNAYVREVHASREPLSQSVIDACATLVRLRETPDLDCSFPRIDRVTREEFTRWHNAIQDLLNWSDVLEKFETYPWRETLATDFSLELQSAIADHYTRLATHVARLGETVERVRAVMNEEGHPGGYTRVMETVRLAEHASASPQPPRHWLRHAEPARLRALAAETERVCVSYNDLRARFDAAYQPAALDLEHEVLLATLTKGGQDATRYLRADTPGGQPHDRALREHEQLDTLLPEASAALADIAAAARSLATLCAWDAPQTLNDVRALMRAAGCALATPTPPKAWFDADAFVVTRALALDAHERYTRCAQTRAYLDSVYTPALYQLDLAALAQRYQANYANVTRYLRPGYYRDQRSVTATLRQDQLQHPAEQTRRDVATAASLAREEDTLRERRVEHARALGRFFDGRATDWERLRAAIEWMDTFQTLFGLEPSAQVIALVSGSAQSRAALGAEYARLGRLVATWEGLAPRLNERLHVRELAQTASSFEQAELDHAQQALRELHALLRPFWDAAATMRRYRRNPDLPTWQHLCDETQLARDVRRHSDWLSAEGARLRAEFGSFFTGFDTDWGRISAALAWSEALLAFYPGREIPGSCARLLSAPNEAEQGTGESLERLRTLAREARQTSDAVEEELRFSDTALPRAALVDGATFGDVTLTTLGVCIERRLEELPYLERWIACKRLWTTLCERGLESFLHAARRQVSFPQGLPDMFEKSFYQRWLDYWLKQSPALADFHGERHEKLIARFRELDERHSALARRRLHTLLEQRRAATMRDAQRPDAPTPLSEALAFLKKEAHKKRHGSIRQIVHNSAPALLALKPCWMMSPQSVSQFVTSGEQLFDVVIFDEASQVRPADAIGAVLRGKQLIVVGDSKQLPPTSFFEKSLADDDDEDAETEATADAKVSQERTESILDECAAIFPRAYALKWHYRSQHESLIAFSNHHFYDDQLITFPNPDASHAAGLRFEYVEGAVYDRARSRTNRQEAERIVDLLVEQVQQDGLTLGVIALSVAQQNAIYDAIERRIKSDPLARAFEEELRGDGKARLFVKNLESVQGDERDVILLSIGYGRDAAGRVYNNFGPVNGNGGERRLNVAVTRARQQMIVVSSIHASDLSAELRSPGARALRAYLDYAERGTIALSEQRLDEVGSPNTPTFDSPFEVAVYNALTARGMRLTTQVGCSGYRIDLAAHHPQRPERYILGIECDGATYHGSATARDRDRLRQRHLERMGWRIHRIWSRDWARNPAGEIEKTLEALQRALDESDTATDDTLERDAAGVTSTPRSFPQA